MRFFTKQTGWAAGMLLMLAVGCKKEIDPATATPAEACRLQTETYTSDYGPSQRTYAYDGSGNMVSSLKSSTSVNGIQTTRYDYQYDASGLLVQQIESYKSTFSESKETNTYQYDKGRLTKQTSILGSSTSTKAYEYASDGALTKYIVTRGSDIRTFLFTNGKLTSADYKSATKTYPSTVVDGRITRQFFYEDTSPVFSLLEYNGNGQIRKISIVDDKGNASKDRPAVEFEYETQSIKLPAPVAFKGHPAFVLYGSEEALRRTVETYPVGSGNEKYNRTEDYQYKTNSKGAVTEKTITTKVGTSTSATRTAYTYTNCQ